VGPHSIGTRKSPGNEGAQASGVQSRYLMCLLCAGAEACAKVFGTPHQTLCRTDCPSESRLTVPGLVFAGLELRVTVRPFFPASQSLWAMCPAIGSSRESISSGSEKSTEKIPLHADRLALSVWVHRAIVFAHNELLEVPHCSSVRLSGVNTVWTSLLTGGPHDDSRRHKPTAIGSPRICAGKSRCSIAA